MITRPFLLHALSPLHAGTGQAAEIVDLPTARMKGTGIPFIPGSSIKGVLREGSTGRDPTKTDAAFGPSANPDAHAGAIAVGDARLLALPVRSFRGTFAWVTSPLLLVLAQRDLKVNIEIPNDFGAGSRAPEFQREISAQARVHFICMILTFRQWNPMLYRNGHHTSKKQFARQLVKFFLNVL